MDQRIRNRVSLRVLAGALGVSCLTALVSAHRAGKAHQPAPKNPLPFDHRLHVSQEWESGRYPEVWRDCRGCHDYESVAEDRRSPEGACILCHVHNVKGRDVEFQGNGGQDPNRGRGERLFEHGDHLSVECRSCHTPEALLRDPREPRFVPQVHTGYCRSCHDPEATGFKAQSDRRAFIDGLNRRLQVRRSGGVVRFSHREHVAAEALRSKDPAPCLTCHEKIRESGADTLARRQFSTEACNTCHTAAFEVELFTKASITAATFVHRFHMGPLVDARSRDGDNRNLGQSQCRTCHEYDPAADVFVVRDFLKKERQAPRSDGRGPEICLQCHFHQEESWSVSHHGNVEACSACHQIREGFRDNAIMLDNRPTVTVRRPRVTGFFSPRHAHPFITKIGAEENQCRECHLADVPEVPSRTEGREFDHAVHLGPPPDRDDLAARTRYCQSFCEGCHSGTRNSPGPTDVQLYDPGRCATCHEQSRLDPITDGEQTRDVVAFSHLDHLKGRLPELGRRADCLDCHTPEDRTVNIIENALPRRIASCNQCHNHRDRAEITGRVAQEEVSRCTTSCHLMGVPAKGRPIIVERLRVKEMKGAQQHTLDTACSACHQNLTLPERLAYSPYVFAAREKGRAPHNEISIEPGSRQWRDCQACDPTSPKRHSVGDRWHFEESAGCIDCHWADVGKPFMKALKFKNKPYASLSRKQLRDQYGDLKTGKRFPFPGIPPRD